MSDPTLLRVLVVEDNPDDVILLQECFAEHRAVAFALSVARSLADVLTLLAAQPPDCVLLDLGLPDAGGLDGLERLRRVVSDVPVLVLTGLRDDALWVLLSVSLVRDEAGGARYFVSQMKDVTERRQLEAELRHLADHDPLTDLLNRRRFAEELDHHVSRSRRYGEPAALLLLDLDRFKQVNDTLGHSAADELLCRIAAAVRDRLRVSDVVARLGGDEFAVLLPNADRARAELVADALDQVVRFSTARSPVPVTASVGVAVLEPGAPASADELLGEADAAMYAAKDDGRASAAA